MATLSELVAAIQNIVQDSRTYTEPVIVKRINEAVNAIAGGIRMSNGQVSPPLPDLFTYSTIDTSATLPYVALPATYQRNVISIYDSSGNKFSAPSGGGYYAFSRFLEQAADKRLTEAGSVYLVSIKGSKLYYQGIPTVAETIGLHFYRKPVDMALDGDVPDGLPDHLSMRLVKHYVCKEILGEAIEDGQDNAGVGVKYHTVKFNDAMTDLIDFVGIDAVPEYYGTDGVYDLGACD